MLSSTWIYICIHAPVLTVQLWFGHHACQGVEKHTQPLTGSQRKRCSHIETASPKTNDLSCYINTFVLSFTLNVPKVMATQLNHWIFGLLYWQLPPTPCQSTVDCKGLARVEKVTLSTSTVPYHSQDVWIRCHDPACLNLSSTILPMKVTISNWLEMSKWIYFEGTKHANHLWPWECPFECLTVLTA